MPTPVRRQSSSHLYPKSSYAAPSVLPNAMPMLSSTPAPIAPQQAIPANGYQSVNFNTYATPAGRMASGLGYNDPVMAQYLAQQQRNALTPQQRAYVDATPQIMANRMAGEIPPGPRSPQEAAINNVGGTYSNTASDATKAVYQAAAQRQAARMAAYKSLVARRYGGNGQGFAAPQSAQNGPAPVNVSYGPNGMSVTPRSPAPAAPIAPAPAAPGQAPAVPPAPSPTGSARTVPNMAFPQGLHNAPTNQPYVPPVPPGQRAANNIGNAFMHSPVIGPAGSALGNLWYGNPRTWNPKLPSNATPKPSMSMPKSQWGNNPWNYP